VRYQSGGEDRLKWVDVRDDQQIVHDEKAFLATIDDGSDEEEEGSSEDLEVPMVSAGDSVKVYSASVAEWISGVVEEVNLQAVEVQVRYTAGAQERLKWVDLRDPKQLQVISDGAGVVQPEPTGGSSDSDVDTAEDVEEGSMADRIDDALDPGCNDVERIQKLLADICQSRFSHPALESLEDKCRRLGGAIDATAAAVDCKHEGSSPNDTSKIHQSASPADPSEVESDEAQKILAQKAEVEAAMQRAKDQKGSTGWKRRLSITR
jgi:hypothetical protein